MRKKVRLRERNSRDGLESVRMQDWSVLQDAVRMEDGCVMVRGHSQERCWCNS